MQPLQCAVTHVAALILVGIATPPRAVVAQQAPSCPERTFQACAVRIQDSRFIIRGIAAQPIGTLGWNGGGFASVLTGSDSGVYFARRYATHKKRSLALNLIGGIAGGIAGFRIKSIHNTGWVAVGIGGTLATFTGAYQGIKAENAAQRAVWWYNNDVSTPRATADRFPSDSVVGADVGRLVDKTPGAGILIALIEADGQVRVIRRGVSGRDGVPLTDSTVFEIGSLTKVFTAATLAEMASRGEVRLTDPVSQYLRGIPPRTGARDITLMDLATHTSGLPRLPSNLAPTDTSNPYAGYSTEQLDAFLATYRSSSPPGSAYEYSNAGFGVLGRALALRAGTSYEALVRARLLDPLAMYDTRITLDAALERRLAVGHDQRGRSVPLWDLPALAGAGALRSTMRDLIRFAQANMTTQAGDIPAALATARAYQHRTTTRGTGVALGWQVEMAADDTTPRFVWKDGETGGFSSFMGIDAAHHRAAIILANVAGADWIDGIGLGLLHRDEVPSTNTAPSDDTLRSYEGEYALNAGFHMVVSFAGHALSVQGTGQAKLTLLPSGVDAFNVVGVAARVSFVRDERGRVAQLVLEQGGKKAPAPRVR